MTVRVKFAWYDMWVGAYVDRPGRTLYVCPLPCILVTIRRRNRAPQKARR